VIVLTVPTLAQAQEAVKAQLLRLELELDLCQRISTSQRDEYNRLDAIEGAIYHWAKAHKNQLGQIGLEYGHVIYEEDGADCVLDIDFYKSTRVKTLVSAIRYELKFKQGEDFKSAVVAFFTAQTQSVFIQQQRMKRYKDVDTLKSLLDQYLNAIEPLRLFINNHPDCTAPPLCELLACVCKQETPKQVKHQ
jgi:hypothetical protein